MAVWPLARNEPHAKRNRPAKVLKIRFMSRISTRSKPSVRENWWWWKLLILLKGCAVTGVWGRKPSAFSRQLKILCAFVRVCALGGFLAQELNRRRVNIDRASPGISCEAFFVQICAGFPRRLMHKTTLIGPCPFERSLAQQDCDDSSDWPQVADPPGQRVL
jgi:hypothetical protein